MANEISSNVTLNISKGGASRSASGSGTDTMSGKNIAQFTQTIATSATALLLPGITGTPPVVCVKNLDSTNYVEIDSANTFDKFPQKLAAGAVVLLRPQTATIYLKANTAAVQVEVLASEP